MVDPTDAHVRALSDTVPSIIGGVPIRMRTIRVNIDRPDFMINPTNCSAFTVGSQGIGDQGTVVDFSSFFHADNCGTLGFDRRSPSASSVAASRRSAARTRRCGSN